MKRAGVASTHLHDVASVGDAIAVKAPGGQFHVDVESSDPIVLVGGGVGVTPLLSMLAAIADTKRPREAWLFYGVRDDANIAHRDEIEAARAAGVRVHVCASARGERVTIERLRAALPSSAYRFYVCGPNGLMEAITEGLLDWGVPLERIHFEAFGPSTVKKLVKAKAHGAPASRALAAAPSVTFRRSGVTATWDPESSTSLLDLAEANGIAIETGCCVGSCGTCATRVLAGAVTYASEPGEPPPEGSCFACIAAPKGDLEIDA